MTGPTRGDGVGIESTPSILRGIRLDHQDPDRLHAIAEVPIVVPGEPQSVIDAFVRLRAELGKPAGPTRIGTFPAGAALQRVDATGLTGPELNQRRAALEAEFGVSSTMLLDDGPRRWLITLSWEVGPLRAIAHSAERAGFVDVVVEPSPVAICRAVGADAAWVRRDAADGEAFRLVVHNNVPVAAISAHTVGRAHPNVELRRAVSAGLFDSHLERADLAALMDAVAEATADGVPERLVFLGTVYPPYPAHDIRSAERQCVALGAAVGAAGLAGPVRPVDVTVPHPQTDHPERPWAIELLDDVTPANHAFGAVRRAAARVNPLRQRRR